jgi:hypothetical protein
MAEACAFLTRRRRLAAYTLSKVGRTHHHMTIGKGD